MDIGIRRVTKITTKSDILEDVTGPVVGILKIRIDSTTASKEPQTTTLTLFSNTRKPPEVEES